MKSIIALINQGGIKNWNRFYLAFRVFEVLDFLYNIIVILLKITGKLQNPIYFFIMILLLPPYYLLRRTIKMKGEFSMNNLEHQLAETGVDLTKFSYHKMSRLPPLAFIRLDYHLSTILSFSAAVNYAASDSDEFSEDDLGLIQSWISNDKNLKNCLERYTHINEEDFGTLMFILAEKSDTTSTQWCQLCGILLEFMGSEPKSEEIRKEMCF